MKLNKDIVEIAIESACNCISEHLPKDFIYHDVTHTVAVVEGAEWLAKKMNVPKRQRMLLAVAAWYHDTGYVQQMDGHETYGAQLAEMLLREYKVDEEDIAVVKDCILATRYPQQPQTLLQQIICDADMLHLSSKDFLQSSDKLRDEWARTKGLVYTDKDWWQLNLEFLTNHRYHTDYAKEFLTGKKERNINAIKKKLKSPDADYALVKAEQSLAKKQRGEKAQTAKTAETLFKTASGNHIRLSAMADNKAHILLSINSIIISVVLSILTRKLTQATYLIFPTIILLSACVTTIVFAVLATKPKVSKGIFTQEQVDRKEVNLLFFGNFHRMEFDFFEQGIKEVLNDREYLYRSMTKDIYFLGKVLAAKYHYLNAGYRVFMFGMITSVLAFAVSFMFAAHGG